MLIRIWKDLTKSFVCDSKPNVFLLAMFLGSARLLCCDDPAMKTTEELYSHQQVRFFPKGGDDDDRKLEPGTHEGREDLLITSFFSNGRFFSNLKIRLSLPRSWNWPLRLLSIDRRTIEWNGGIFYGWW